MRSKRRSAEMSQPWKELGTALLLLLVLVPFSLKISEIYIDPSDPGFGSQDFPRLIVWLGIGLSLILGAKAIVKLRADGLESHAWQLTLSSPLILFFVAGAYIYAIGLFQYALPTLALLVFLTAFFGNKGWKRLILAPVCAVCIYYFVFFILFGIFEQPGTILYYDSYGFARTVREFLGFN